MLISSSPKQRNTPSREAAGNFWHTRRVAASSCAAATATAASTPTELMVVVFFFFFPFLIRSLHVATPAPGCQDHRGPLLRDGSEEGVL